MERKYLNSQFWKYILPSMFTMLLSGFYSIVDGLFVGNSVGNDALAAINLVYPIQVILNASAIGIGIGGAVALSYFSGRDETKSADQSLGSTITLLIVAGIVLSIVLFFATPTLLEILGASGTIYEYAYDYIFVILCGGLLPVLGNGLSPLIRNYGKTIVATICMSSGLVTNIVLDYIFVFLMEMGLSGAALATIIAQGVVALSCLAFLYASKLKEISLHCYVPSVSLIKRIITVGISPFGQTMIPCIMIVLTNWTCIMYGGNDALTIYSVISYVLSSAQLLLQGIGDGVQPLLSYYHGKGNKDVIHYLYRKAFFVSLGVSVILFMGVYLFNEPLTGLFGVSHSLYDGTKLALIITALSFPFIGISRLTSAVFYASGRSKNSTFLVYIEPCLLLPVFLIVFSSLFQLTGVWCAYPATQVVLSVIALVLQSPNLVADHEKKIVEVSI